MASLNEKIDIQVDQVAWKCFVHNPVMRSVHKRFKTGTDLADAIHSTNFILRSLIQEMPKIIYHATYSDKQNIFASVVILASAAPKSVYKAVCQSMPNFLDYVIEANGLTTRIKPSVQKYFHETGQIALMFVRDAVYISCPSNIEQLTKFDKEWKRDDIIRYTRLLTLAMCQHAVGIPKIHISADMKERASSMVSSMQTVTGIAFINQGDSLSKIPPAVMSLNSRRNQIIQFITDLL